MKAGETIFVINQRNGQIEERVILRIRKSLDGFVTVDKVTQSTDTIKTYDPHWCFYTREEAEEFKTAYKKEMQEKIKRTDIMRDMFEAWAHEYSNEKDIIQKEAMLDYLQETFSIKINFDHYHKTITWDTNAVQYRKNQSLQK